MANQPLSEEERRVIMAELHELGQEHRDLDTVIERLSGNPPDDQLLIRRLKKRKLALKDRMRILESQLIPDIPA